MKQTRASLASVVVAIAVTSYVPCTTATTSAPGNADDVPRAGMYDGVRGPELPPGLEIGETSAVAVDRNGHMLKPDRNWNTSQPSAFVSQASRCSTPCTTWQLDRTDHCMSQRRVPSA